MSTQEKFYDLDEKEMQKVSKLFLEEGKSFTEIFDVSPEVLENYYALAYNNYTTGQFNDSLILFKMLVLYSPLDLRFIMGLAGCYQSLNLYNQAIDAYSLAVEVADKDDIKPLFYRAVSLLKSEEHKDLAKGELENIINIKARTEDLLLQEKAKNMLKAL